MNESKKLIFNEKQCREEFDCDRLIYIFTGHDGGVVSVEISVCEDTLEPNDEANTVLFNAKELGPDEEEQIWIRFFDDNNNVFFACPYDLERYALNEAVHFMESERIEIQTAREDREDYFESIRLPRRSL